MSGQQQLLASYGAVPSTFTGVIDNFDDNAISAAWVQGFGLGTAAGATVAETNQRLEITGVNAAGTNINGLVTAAARDITGSGDYVFVAKTQDSTSVPARTFFGHFNDANNAVYFVHNGGNLQASYRNASASGTVVATVAWGTEAATHRWWRVREASGSIFWDTAPLSASVPPLPAEWTQFATMVKPANFALATAKQMLNAGSSDATGTALLVAFDHFNLGAT